MVDRPGKARRNSAGLRGCRATEPAWGSGALTGWSGEPPWMQPGRPRQQPEWGATSGWGARVCEDFWVAGRARVWVRHAQPRFPLGAKRSQDQASGWEGLAASDLGSGGVCTPAQQ